MTAMTVGRPAAKPVDRLLGVYALISVLAHVPPGRPAGAPFIAVLHIAFAWVTLGGQRAATVRAALSRFPLLHALRDWYPLLMLPLLYSELVPLNLAAHGGRMFDEIVIAWEQTLFGGQPSRDWARAVPNLLLSEILHAAYLSYYLLMYIPALVIFVRRPRAEFRFAVFTIILAFTTHYLFFIYFPVEGPRYRFEAPTGGIEDGFFYALTHRALEAGSSRGAAFPSSHVGASAAVTIAVLRTLPRGTIIPAILTLGLALGAVYGGFHYATDAVAGLLLGLIMAAVAPGIFRLLGGNRPDGVEASP